MTDDIVIVSYARTPIGKFQGVFSNTKAPALGASAIKAALERGQVNAEQVNECIMGCVLSAGLGQAPARQAALGAEVPESSGALTINKMCGSGLKAVMLASDLLKAGQEQLFVAGGLENMTAAPYLLNKARGGYRLGHGEIKDHMFLDGLEDAYEPGRLMGTYAEDTAAKYQFSREQQDEFAKHSVEKAQTAITNGYFKEEITPFTVKNRKGDIEVLDDEIPPGINTDKISQLKPAFSKEGTVTAANSSSIADGGAALVLTTASYAKQHNLPVVARIAGHSSHANAPAWFTTAPGAAMQKLFTQTGWQADAVDLYEINEAFAVVTMAAMHDLNLPAEKVNIHGGACALGHPIGASGARILVTLLSALKRTGGKRGIASLCIGGGEAVAVAVEMV